MRAERYARMTPPTTRRASWSNWINAPSVRNPRGMMPGDHARQGCPGNSDPAPPPLPAVNDAQPGNRFAPEMESSANFPGAVRVGGAMMPTEPAVPRDVDRCILPRKAGRRGLAELPRSHRVRRLPRLRIAQTARLIRRCTTAWPVRSSRRVSASALGMPVRRSTHP